MSGTRTLVGVLAATVVLWAATVLLFRGFNDLHIIYISPPTTLSSEATEVPCKPEPGEFQLGVDPCSEDGRQAYENGARFSPRDRATGCFCDPPNCAGISVTAGADVPPSSILQPHPGERGTLYKYLKASKAEVDGVLWIYVDENNQPASERCVGAQLQFFRYEKLREIK